MPRRRARGEGYIDVRHYTRKDGTNYKRYYARVTAYNDGKKQIQKPGPMRKTEKEAKIDLQRMQHEFNRNELSVGAKPLIKDYLVTWLKNVSITKKFGTYQTYYQTVKADLIPAVGHIKLDKLKHEHVQKMVNDIFRRARENVHSPPKGKLKNRQAKDGKALARKALATLRKAFEDAIYSGLMPRDYHNPCRRVVAPSEEAKPLTIWTPEESARFLVEAKKTRLYPIIYTALTSGMREGELCALRWQDLEEIDVIHEGKVRKLLKININHTLKKSVKSQAAIAKIKMKHLHGQFYLDTPKTKKSLGSILVAEDTRELLTHHKATQVKTSIDLGLVFPASSGAPQNPRNLLRDYQKIIKSAGVSVITFHDLRDSHISLLQSHNVDLAVLSERARHSRKSTTADKYVHTVTSSRLEGVMSLEAMLGKKVST